MRRDRINQGIERYREVHKAHATVYRTGFTADPFVLKGKEKDQKAGLLFAIEKAQVIVKKLCDYRKTCDVLTVVPFFKKSID